MKRIIIGLLVLSMTIGALLTGCGGDDTVKIDPSIPKTGEIILELYPNVAPETVANFEKLVSEGFYDGKYIHRAVDGFMIQGGSVSGDGRATDGEESIKGEFTENGFENNLKHTRGVISMARGGSADSATTQFFIMQADAPHLDGKYASFGEALSGLDIVDGICKMPATGVNNDELIVKPVITSVEKVENYQGEVREGRDHIYKMSIKLYD